MSRPRPHQVEAINAVQDALLTHDRAQLLMACGTGKTLVGRWLAERRRASTTLVVVPSLALIAQTLVEWRAAGDWLFEALIICCDPSTADGAAELASREGEQIPVPFWATHRAQVTTSPRRAAEVLASRQSDRPLVVFSTYHSAHVAAAAARTSGRGFDLLIADEAHRLAGHPRSDFRCILNDSIPASARVFMTATQITAATPSTTQPGWDNWSAPLSMDDATLFGPVAYRLDFAAAIAQELLSDYEILIYETPGETTPDPVAALTAAAGRGLTRVLSFHGRVAKAQAFAAAVDGHLLPDGRRVIARAVAGADPAIRRSRALQLLQDPDPTTLVVISSARCLAEGVDIPAVDGILFADPKNSDVDVIQAVGRVLRRSPGKSTGQVLIPVCYSPGLDEDTTLSTSSFAAVWRILRGLRSLDARLAADLATPPRTASRRGVHDGSRRPARIAFDLPSALNLPELVTRLVDATSPAWDGFFTELEDYTAAHGHCRPPTSHRLHGWCARQRTAHRRGMLMPERSAALTSLPGWTWDLDEQNWREQWAEVLVAAQATSVLADLAVTERCIRHAGAKSRVTTIGRWCAAQRIAARRGDLDQSRRTQLEQIPGWQWSALSAQDEICLDLLGEYVAWKGDANVPAGYVDDDQELGDWLTGIRRRRALGNLEQPLLDELHILTPAPPSAAALRWERGETLWAIALSALHQYAAREGRCRMPEHHVERFTDGQVSLYTWCRLQRHDHRHGRLSPERVAALDAVDGWLWEIQPSERVLMEIGDARHGTRTGYVKGCRCAPCTDANRADHQTRAARAQAGQPATDMVSAAHARGHLRILQGQGATQKGLARAADINVKMIVEILDGTRSRILADTERILLAVRIDHVRNANAPGTLVPADETWRLIDALLSRGWPKSWIAREAGLGIGGSLQLGRGQITAGNAQRVAELSARVVDITPPPRPHRAPYPTLQEILTTLARSA